MYIIHICIYSQFSDSVKTFVFVFLSYIFKRFSIKSLAVYLLVVALKAYISSTVQQILIAIARISFSLKTTQKDEK